jgi:serine/threonine-protein kinase
MTERYAPDVGETFGGYTIESVLGRGGMGTVYLATHERLARKVALKVIAPRLAHDGEFRERFLRESRLAASLDHPNVIPIYDADEVDGVLFLSMRYVGGPSLKALIEDHGMLSPEETLGVVEQIAGALDAAHGKSLVHRDVKPANVLLTEAGGHAYLCDFGLAKHTSAGGLTQTGFFLGSVDYCAPEQIQQRHVDGRADVYSLGCVVFHSLAGRPPYTGESELDVLNAHLRDPVPRISELRSDVPAALDRVLETAMAKAPDERYQSAGALASALAAALGDGATRAVPTRRMARPVLASQRRRFSPRFLGVAALVLVVALGGAAAGIVATRGSDGGEKATLPGFVDDVEGILTASANGRRQIGNALEDGLRCRIPPSTAALRMQRVVENRRRVIERLGGVAPPAGNAARAVALLRRAINESIEADIHYRDGFRASDSCPIAKNQDFEDAIAADTRATAAKQRFVETFNDLARQFERREWVAGEI